MKAIRLWESALLISTIGCAATYAPPLAPGPRPTTAVAASSGKTWDAVIDLFAEQTVPIRNMERASGIIVTDPLTVSEDDAPAWADCGTLDGRSMLAGQVSYNVLVRGDSSRSNVRVTTRFLRKHYERAPTDTPVECVSTGRWERAFEYVAAARAEGRTITMPTIIQRPRCEGDRRVVRDGDDLVVAISVQARDGTCGDASCRYPYREGLITEASAIARCQAESRREE